MLYPSVTPLICLITFYIQCQIQTQYFSWTTEEHNTICQTYFTQICNSRRFLCHNHICKLNLLIFSDVSWHYVPIFLFPLFSASITFVVCQVWKLAVVWLNRCNFCLVLVQNSTSQSYILFMQIDIYKIYFIPNKYIAYQTKDRLCSMFLWSTLNKEWKKMVNARMVLIPLYSPGTLE